MRLIFRFVRSHAVNHAVLIEDQFIIDRRKHYVKSVQKYKAEGIHIFYLDESYIHQHHCPTRILTDTTVKSAADAAERGLTTGSYSC